MGGIVAMGGPVGAQRAFLGHTSFVLKRNLVLQLIEICVDRFKYMSHI